MTTLYAAGFDWDLKSGGEPSAVRVEAVGLREQKQERRRKREAQDGKRWVLKGCICGGLGAFSLRIESVTLARPEAGASLKATRTHSSQAVRVPSPALGRPAQVATQ